MTEDTPPKCIIFDCDGTLVDSEEITNEIIAKMAGELGVKMTGEEATATFRGKTISAVIKKMKELSDNEIPEDWRPRLIKKVSVAWRTQLNAVEGVEELLESLEIPVCVASNGEPTHINQSLEMTGLSDFFDGNIFSAADIGVPKPAPDLFLYAAEKMGFKPEECIVVEDSVTGVTAAKRANMKVYGFGNSRTIGHISSAEELQNAGAIPFTKMQELSALLGI